MSSGFHQSRIRDIAPNLGDGATTTFTTPSNYKTGTIRVFINGIQYPPDDDDFGWTETGSATISMTTAPRTGDEMSAFYQEDDAIPASDLAIGSPFAPGEVC